MSLFVGKKFGVSRIFNLNGKKKCSVNGCHDTSTEKSVPKINLPTLGS